MLEERQTNGRRSESGTLTAGPQAEAREHRDGTGVLLRRHEGPQDRPRLRVRVIERAAIVHFQDAEVVAAEEDVRAVLDPLERLAEVDGHRRLVLNLRGVRYLSDTVLGGLAEFQQRFERIGGRVQVCGLDPLLREVLRVRRLDPVFDLCDDEADALGLLVR